MRCMRTANSSPRRHIWLPQPPATSLMASPARSGCCSRSRSRTRSVVISVSAMRSHSTEAGRRSGSRSPEHLPVIPLASPIRFQRAAAQRLWNGAGAKFREACIRCSKLRPEPEQRARLAETRLSCAEDKLVQLDSLKQRADPVSSASACRRSARSPPARTRPRCPRRLGLRPCFPDLRGPGTPGTAPRRVVGVVRVRSVHGRSSALRCTAPDAPG